jgi:hypothetical protein
MTDDEETYLYVVGYEEDAERKRVEYLFDNWDGGEIERPDGLVRIARDVDPDALYERLVTKVPVDQVSSYCLDPADPDVSEESVVVEREVEAPREAVESFVEYIFSKKKAVLQSAANDEYEVYTKKGRADVSYTLSDGEGTTTVRIRITGYPPAPEFLGEVFETELTDYAESQA